MDGDGDMHAGMDAGTTAPDAGLDAGHDGGGDAGRDATLDAGPPGEVTWLSGARVGPTPADLDAFGVFRNRPLDLTLYFVDRTVGWPGVVEPGWPLDMLRGSPLRLILALPLYPEGQGNNSDCAAGAYDSEWQKLGPYLRNYGRENSIIRLGWGPNDSEHLWRADADASEWVSCFQRVVDAIRAGGIDPEIAWDFNPSGDPVATDLDPYSAYPGDDYVDYVGIEEFDRYPPSLTRAEWQDKCEGETGLCTLLDFARAHGKRLGIPEWGVAACSPDGGGDNPDYITWMFEFLVDNADAVGFELYYEEGGDICSGLSGTNTQNPRSAERYRYLFGER